MIYKAGSLMKMLRHLTLTGQIEKGVLEFIGTKEQRDKCEECQLCNDSGVWLAPNEQDDYDKEICQCEVGQNLALKLF